MEPSNRNGCKSVFWRFINPRTLIRPDFLAGSSMVRLALARHRESDLSASQIHQNNTERSGLGLLVSATLPGHVWLWQASGQWRLLSDFLTRFHRRRAFLARRFSDDRLEALVGFVGEALHDPCERMGLSLEIVAVAMSRSSGQSVLGLPLRGLSCNFWAPEAVVLVRLIQADTVTRWTR